MRPLLIVLVVALSACTANRTADDAVPPPPAIDSMTATPGTETDTVSGLGTIVFVDLEGGFYGLRADDGNDYNPLNLDDAFKQDSLRVRFSGVLRSDVMTTRMWGKNLEIQEMERQ